MATGGENERGGRYRQGAARRVVASSEPTAKEQTVIFNPDFFVEKLRHEQPEVFAELVLSHISRLIDLPGSEFAQLQGAVEPEVPPSSGFLRSFNFLKRKDKGVIFGAPLTEEGIAQVYQLIEYLAKSLHVEGLFRVPGNSIRQQALREMLNSGADIDLETGDYHPNDVATVLKAFLGELPEPLLTHRHFHAHLKIADLTRFDEEGNKTTVPDKERQIQSLQLLLMLLPPPNRSLLKLLLDLLYRTAKHQDKNKMSALNLALMFAPHIIWPKKVNASNLQENICKLNDSVAFLIKHSQKLFKAPVYIREHARMHFSSSKISQTQVPVLLSLSSSRGQHTEEALKELFDHVSNMPESAQKKRFIRQLNKQGPPGSSLPDCRTPSDQKHRRSRSFSGFIKVCSAFVITGQWGNGHTSSSSFTRKRFSPTQCSAVTKLQY
uniref:Rho GTPase-activating protein 19 n=1 Tax=Denticeps clupeoides TaxID=299321 RepID=A0AAY4CE79_9TELE